MDAELSTEIRFGPEKPEVAVAALGLKSGVVTRGKKNELWLNLPYRLSRARWAQEKSAKALSLDGGLNENAARIIEDEEAVPRIDTIERLAAALAVSPGWLAFGPDGTMPFRERIKRSPVALPDPVPSSRMRVYRGRHGGCADRVRGAREASGLSMRQLSSAAGVSVQTWSNTEAGKTVPKVDSLERMAVALGVAPAWLAYGYEEAD